MGSTTAFTGRFTLDRKLEPQHDRYLRAFNNTRHIRRDATTAEMFADPTRESADLPIGEEGGYYVGDAGHSSGQCRNLGDLSILDYNVPPAGQPGLWCRWKPTKDSAGVQWDGNEKFYYHVEWLEYLILHFLKPWGYQLSGEVTWTGEKHGDFGLIRIVNNSPVKLPPQWTKEAQT